MRSLPLPATPSVPTQHIPPLPSPHCCTFQFVLARPFPNRNDSPGFPPRSFTSQPPGRPRQFSDRHRPLDQFHGHHKPRPVSHLHQNSLHSSKRPRLHSYPPSHLEVRMGLGTSTACQASSQRVDLFLRQSCRRSIEANQFRYSRNLQHLQAVAQRKTHKDVPWEQRKLQFYPPVFPPSYRLVERQEMLNRPDNELLRRPFFVVCAGVGGIPKQLTRVGR